MEEIYKTVSCKLNNLISYMTGTGADSDGGATRSSPHQERERARERERERERERGDSTYIKRELLQTLRII